MFLFAKKEENKILYTSTCGIPKNIIFVILIIIVINLTDWVDFHLKPCSADIAASIGAIRGCC